MLLSREYLVSLLAISPVGPARQFYAGEDAHLNCSLNGWPWDSVHNGGFVNASNLYFKLVNNHNMTQLYEQQVQAVDGETIGITIPGMYVTRNLTGTYCLSVLSEERDTTIAS